MSQVNIVVRKIPLDIFIILRLYLKYICTAEIINELFCLHYLRNFSLTCTIVMLNMRLDSDLG